MNTIAQQDLLNMEELQIPHAYGKFWSRFWALLLDGLILGVLVTGPLAYYNTLERKSGMLFIAMSFIKIAYKVFFEYTYGATPGKMALKLRVVNYQYEKASFSQILLRNMFQIISVLISSGIGLYTYYQATLLAGLFQNFNLTRGAAIAVGSLRVIIFIFYLVDLGFLLSSTTGRSLHDRIGKTYVIKLR